jgi:hypothetical protein
MDIKGAGDPGDWQAIDRFDGGVGWMAYPAEGMQRASHALVEDGDVWLIDPLDTPGLDDLLADEGEVAGVVLLLSRHGRDAAAIARRHDVAVHVPRLLDVDVDARVESFSGELADTGYVAHTVYERFPWREAALYSEDRRTLVVAEGLGTAPWFLAPGERLGVQPVARLFPPKTLARFDPAHVLVGHGEGVHEDAAAAVTQAVRRSRRGLPRVALRNVRELAPF